VAGLEDGEPRLCGDAGDAGIRCEGVDVDQLADAPGAELDEALEGSEVLDFENLPHIPLQIGADVVLEPEGWFYRAVVNRWEEAGVKKFVHRGRCAVGGLEFRQGEGQKGEHGCPPGEALGDRLDQFELTGSGEDEASHPPVGIDDSLKIREESGDSLNLIENGSVRGLAQECAWVLSGEGPGVRVFQGKVGKVRGEEAGQGCFSRLPGTGNAEDRESSQALPRCLGRMARYGLWRDGWAGISGHDYLYSGVLHWSIFWFGIG